MFEKIKQFIEKILSFNIGNFFKAEINNKFADTVKDNALFEYNKTENNKTLIQQNFQIAILPELNVDESIKSALLKGNENAKEIGIDVINLFKQNNISEEQITDKLSNPEILYITAKASEIAYKTSDIDKRKILSDLIFKKLKEEINTDDSNILSLAIQEMDILTINHIKAISFLYLIKSNYLKSFTEHELNQFYDKVFSTIFNFKNSSAKSVGKFLASTRTISAAHIGWDITSYLPQMLTDENKSSKTIKEEFSKWHTLWNELGFMGAYITPIGEYIAKIYLFNTFGITIEDKNNKIEGK